MSYPHTEISISPEFLAFQKHVAEKTAISSRPLRTAAYMWTRYLCRPEFIPDVKITKRASSNFAKFNDGFGKSGVTLEEAVAGIRKFIRGKDSEGNVN